MEDIFFKVLNIFLVIIIGLIGIAYKRICDDITEIKKKEEACAIHALVSDIAEIKTNIKWILGKLFNEKPK